MRKRPQKQGLTTDLSLEPSRCGRLLDLGRTSIYSMLRNREVEILHGLGFEVLMHPANHPMLHAITSESSTSTYRLCHLSSPVAFPLSLTGNDKICLHVFNIVLMAEGSLPDHGSQKSGPGYHQMVLVFMWSILPRQKGNIYRDLKQWTIRAPSIPSDYRRWTVQIACSLSSESHSVL